MHGRHPQLFRCIAAILAIAIVAPPAAADGAATLGSVLIQAAADGKFRVWTSDGESVLSENELLILEGTAVPEGGPPLGTRFGPARAFETPDGIVVELPDAPRDKALLLDHDACTAIRAWHAARTSVLSDDQLADVYLSAAPDGGRTLQIGQRLVKAYATRLGVKAVFWTPLQKPK
jgi:hypothetical protein